MEFKKYKLKNGLRVILAPTDNTATATVLFLVATGSKYENSQNNGISHFLEHLAFKGTKKRPTPKQITAEIDAIGGEVNAFTGEEYTGYWVRLDSQHLSLGLDFIADIVLHSLLPPKEVKKERGVILEEINMYEDQPMSKVEIDFTRVLYGDQPAGYPIAGSKEVIKKISRQQIVAYWQRQYTAANSLLVVAGNLGGGKKVLAEANALFGRLKQGGHQSKLPVKNSQQKPALKISFKETEQTHLLVGFKGGNLFNDQDKYPLSILASLMGGYMSARLFQEIREKRGWAYYVHGYIDFLTDSGVVGGQAGVLNSRAKESIGLILREFRKIKEGRFSQKEVAMAKNNMIGRMALSLENSQQIAGFLGKTALLEGKILTPQQIFDKIKAVKTADLRRVAKKYFINRGLNLALIGPHQNEESFKKILKI